MMSDNTDLNLVPITTIEQAEAWLDSLSQTDQIDNMRDEHGMSDDEIVAEVEASRAEIAAAEANEMEG
jgi:hypothetical protein